MTTAGSFSGHLVDSFMQARSPRGPFGQPLNIATHGPMAFAPQMHGTFTSAFGTQQSSSFFSEPSFMDVSQESANKIAELQVKLNKKLGPEYISQRPGPGGGPKLTYAEGWKIINLANEVFGFNGWSSSVVNITTDFIDYSEETRRFNVGVTAIVRVTLRDGVFHEDVGYGLLENSKSKGQALDKCKKEAVTDAVKRTLRNFGNLLGNCLYDKSYTQEVTKIKIQPPKFDRSDLHRRPEFEEPRPPAPNPPQASTSASSTMSTTYASTSAPAPSRPVIKPDPDASAMPPPPQIPHRAMPQPNATSTPNAKGKAPMTATGLHTPIQTPGGPSGPSRPAQGQSHAQTNEGGMAQRNAERHARLKAIQEAQEAQRREDEARAAAEAQRAQASAAASSVAPQAAAASVETQNSDDYLNSDDDAYFANLDYDALDEGIGRPIEFEEGNTEADVHQEVSIAPAAKAQPHQVPQQRSRTTSGTSAGGTSHRDPNQNHVSARQSSASSGEHASTPSMGGGFSFPSGHASGSSTRSQATAQQPAQAPQVQAPSRGANQSMSSSSSLKRNADIMQGLAQARRPPQGMGLQNPAASSGVQTRREPFAALELGEGGDVKRPRRS